MGRQERERLITRIQRVFKTEEPPSNIVYDTTYADCRMLASFLEGKRWTEITVEDLLPFKHDMSLLSAEGFHYYFPAFLVAALKDPHKADTLVDSVVFVLGFQPNDGGSLIPFTIEEQDVIREFLASYLDLFDEEYWHYDDEQLALLDKALNRWTGST